MHQWLFLIPLAPLVTALLLIIAGKRLSPQLIAITGSVGVLIAALVTGIISANYVMQESAPLRQVLFEWLPMGEYAVQVALHFDQLALVMCCVITGVGFLIHWYAAAYMFSDKDMQRFFVYMNLFVFAMVVLVLADNLVLLFLGWEGVGLCSFLLIGFWYDKSENAAAARKAFIVTRIGDMIMLVGLLILFEQTGTLTIDAINRQGAGLAADILMIVCLCLVGGAVGKSAQIPLQTWLPDAMAGPTPVSALIHAATMVTAGVYLIARMHPLFNAVPDSLTIVAWLGAITLVVAGIAALAQTDIKRVLAYSTMSQIGYMFLGLGAGAYSSAIFHLMTHAFFKALLFLTAGSIILTLHHQQNIFNMGGLLRRLPLTSSLLLIGLLALVAVPGTAGFFSKEAILEATWQSSTAGPLLWLLGLLGAFLTSLYSFRLWFLVSLGPATTEPEDGEYAGWSHFVVPLVPLALLALLGGFIPLNFEQVFGLQPQPHVSPLIVWSPSIAAALGLLLALILYLPRQQARQPAKLHLVRNGLGFDWLYHTLLVRPFCFIARANRKDGVDLIYRGLAWSTLRTHSALATSQSGKTRTYLILSTAGLIVLLGVLIWWH